MLRRIFLTGVLSLSLALALGACDSAKKAPEAKGAPTSGNPVKAEKYTGPTEQPATSGSIDLGAAEAPPVPKGYPDEKSVMSAFMLKQIKTAQGIKFGDEILRQRDIEYGKVGDISLKLDLYRPANAAKPLPCVVAIHGGGWATGKKGEIFNMVTPLAIRGYVAVSVDYRLSDVAPYPAAVQDVKAAIRYLRANAAQYNIDPEKIAVMGFSAGAHLAMMAAYATDVPAFENSGGNEGVSSKVSACIEFYGPTDFTTDWAKTNGTIEGFLKKKYAEAPDLYKEASPVTYITSNTVPTLMFQGVIDGVVQVAQADELAEKLKAANVPYFYDRVAGWPHLMDAQKELYVRFNYFITKFLDKYLPLPA